jgi:hypothetical protein
MYESQPMLKCDGKDCNNSVNISSVTVKSWYAVDLPTVANPTIDIYSVGALINDSSDAAVLSEYQNHICSVYCLGTFLTAHMGFIAHSYREIQSKKAKGLQHPKPKKKKSNG